MLNIDFKVSLSFEHIFYFGTEKSTWSMHERGGGGVADFPAVFFHISHWYLSWNTAGGGNCI